MCVQGMGKRLQVPGKSNRKRLNPQVSVDSMDQWKSFNMSPTDLKVTAKILDQCQNMTFVTVESHYLHSCI